jgi:hypothetical protein
MIWKINLEEVVGGGLYWLGAKMRDAMMIIQPPFLHFLNKVVDAAHRIFAIIGNGNGNGWNYRKEKEVDAAKILFLIAILSEKNTIKNDDD